MSLLWARVAKGLPWDTETHDEHALHPSFEAAGIQHAPCAYTRCDDFDEEHSDAFDRAEERYYNRDFEHGHVDLTKPVYGFETTADMHTIRRYTKHPESRKGKPAIFIHRGRQYIFNGHHGITGALRRGETSHPAMVVDLDKD